MRRPVDPAMSTALRRALGPDLAAEITSTRLPAPGAEVARAALDASASVTTIGDAVIDQRRSDGYRITVRP